MAGPGRFLGTRRLLYAPPTVRSTLVIMATIAVALLLPTKTFAQYPQNSLPGANVLNQQAVEAWSRVDPRIVLCIQTTYHVVPQQWGYYYGIGPSDPRAVAYINQCAASIAAQAPQRSQPATEAAEDPAERQRILNAIEDARDRRSKQTGNELWTGPGFDCEKATQPLAQLICADQELSRIDLLFNQAYSALSQQLR